MALKARSRGSSQIAATEPRSFEPLRTSGLVPRLRERFSEIVELARRSTLRHTEAGLVRFAQREMGGAEACDSDGPGQKPKLTKSVGAAGADFEAWPWWRTERGRCNCGVCTGSEKRVRSQSAILRPA